MKYHFLNLWYDSTWNWTTVSRAIGEHSPTKPILIASVIPWGVEEFESRVAKAEAEERDFDTNQQDKLFLRHGFQPKVDTIVRWDTWERSEAVGDIYIYI